MFESISHIAHFKFLDINITKLRTRNNLHSIRIMSRNIKMKMPMPFSNFLIIYKVSRIELSFRQINKQHSIKNY